MTYKMIIITAMGNTETWNGQSVHRRLNLLSNFEKGGGLGGCNFYIKSKLKSDIFNDKKVNKQKCFALS